MTPGRRQNYSPSGISSDGQKWIAYIENQQWAYDFNSKNWTKIFEHRIRGSYGLTGATDPRTDMLYIPFGYPNMDGTMGTMRVDLKTGIATSDYRNFTLANNKLYAATWNPHLDSVVFVSPSGIFSYTWKDGWKQMRTTGLGVGEIPHRGACLVSVSGGKKMVLFGGADQNVTVYSRDVHILDVDQGVWTKGPSISPEDARNAPACAGSNDQVIIWGGNTEAFASKKFHCPTHQVLVFDVKTNTWVTRYSAPGNGVDS
ncbi:hypothetical protein BGX31_000909 [Mortierella sp. GBA43]|nr:hypothetical protein BGX31_000909 [Mortierella sp. GBA43]